MSNEIYNLLLIGFTQNRQPLCGDVSTFQKALLCTETNRVFALLHGFMP